MRRDYILATVALLIAWVVPTALYGQPMALWTDSVHNYGTFHESDGEQRATFVVVNTGDSPLVITRVQPTCGCTVARFTTTAIAPGESGMVNVTYSPTGRPGPFEKTVWVYTNSVPNRTRLTIKGITIGAEGTVAKYFPEHAAHLVATQTTLAAGEVRKGLIRNNVVTLYNPTRDSVAVAFDNNTSHINIVAKPDTIVPGGISTICFFFNSQRTPVWGINDDTITMITHPVGKDDDTQQSKFNLVANVVEDFSNLTNEQLVQAPVCTVSDHKIVLGDGDIAGDNPLVASLELTNTGKSDLVVHRIMTLDTAMSGACDKTLVKPGEKAIVTIKIDPTKVKGDVLNSDFTIITNDPVNPRIVVRVVGKK